jgi:hypothetical protein
VKEKFRGKVIRKQYRITYAAFDAFENRVQNYAKATNDNRRKREE